MFYCKFYFTCYRSFIIRCLAPPSPPLFMFMSGGSSSSSRNYDVTRGWSWWYAWKLGEIASPAVGRGRQRLAVHLYNRV